MELDDRLADLENELYRDDVGGSGSESEAEAVAEGESGSRSDGLFYFDTTAPGAGGHESRPVACPPEDAGDSEGPGEASAHDGRHRLQHEVARGNRATPRGEQCATRRGVGRHR